MVWHYSSFSCLKILLMNTNNGGGYIVFFFIWSPEKLRMSLYISVGSRSSSAWCSYSFLAPCALLSICSRCELQYLSCALQTRACSALSLGFHNFQAFCWMRFCSNSRVLFFYGLNDILPVRIYESTQRSRMMNKMIMGESRCHTRD